MLHPNQELWSGKEHCEQPGERMLQQARLLSKKEPPTGFLTLGVGARVVKMLQTRGLSSLRPGETELSTLTSQPKAAAQTAPRAPLCSSQSFACNIQGLTAHRWKECTLRSREPATLTSLMRSSCSLAFAPRPVSCSTLSATSPLSISPTT